MHMYIQCCALFPTVPPGIHRDIICPIRSAFKKQKDANSPDDVPWSKHARPARMKPIKTR